MSALRLAIVFISILVAGCAGEPAEDTMRGAADGAPTATTSPSGPTVTASSAPAATPSPSTPATSSAKMEILQTASYRDSIGFFHVIGVARNVGGTNAQFVQFPITFYKADGRVHGSTTTFGMRDVTPAGEKVPFHTLTQDDSAEITEFKVSVTSTPTNRQPTGHGMLAVQGEGVNTNTIGFTHSVGEVANSGTKTAKFVKVVIALYNEDGDIVAADTAYTNPSDIRPGETAGFEGLSTREAIDAATWEMWPEAMSLE